MDRIKITSHENWPMALKYHRLGLAASAKQARADLLNTSFDQQVIISRELKLPLYDVMMAIRDLATV